MTTNPSNNAIHALVSCRLVGVTRRDHDWMFAFDGNTVLVVDCLWRLVSDGRICVTSDDQGQRFGRATAIDAAHEASSRIADTQVSRVELVVGTLDLNLYFSNGDKLQVIPDSSGYEAWSLRGPLVSLIAVGGGTLHKE